MTDGEIREIAPMAHERGAGARGLRAVVERILEPNPFDPRTKSTARIREAARSNTTPSA